MLALPAALGALGDYRQFILYIIQASTSRPGKTDKFPVDYRSGAVANAHDPAIWTDASTACATAAALGPGYGVGFVFTEQDPFFFVDIDHCAQADGTWSPVAQQLMGAFNGAAVEVSASGRGLHIFGRGTAAPHASRNDTYGLEFYTANRFVALTGANAIGDARTDHTAALAWLTASYFPPREQLHGSEWTTGPCEGWTGPTDDDELIRRAIASQSSRSVFGSAISFADLWDCNVTALAKHFPDPVRAYDASRADASLAQRLAFWTGRDCERMQRIMERSGLRRDKWLRDDYLPRTISVAASQQRDVMTERTPQPMPESTPLAEPEAPQQTATTGSTFLDFTQQRELFAGCVYVLDAHKVLIPGGRMLQPEQFKAHFSGRSFPLDIANQKVTRNAWEAFNDSQALQKPEAETACFRPDQKPGAVIYENGESSVNTYWPVKVPRAVGDVTPFTQHLARILPDERDRSIVLSFMAAIVQHKGIKFQWAILLQGAPGNGKTMLSRCVQQAVGFKYSHFPTAQNIASPFNAWLAGNIFIGVEDIYVPEAKEDVLQALLPMITNDYIEIQNKGVDQTTQFVCANFILNANRQGSIRKTVDDRRYAIFHTAQQTRADCIRDGMGGDYFPNLYAWLRGDGKYRGQPSGYSIVTELLHTYPIAAEFDPSSGCQVAPGTSSTDEAIAASLGRVEQEVLEAIEQGTPGFANGWVSSLQLDHLLERVRASNMIPHNRRRELLKSIGYDWHPGLPQGRVNNTVAPDNGRPRLFVKAGSPQSMLTGAAEIARAYTTAQKQAATVSY
jgi:hypothetical protein